MTWNRIINETKSEVLYRIGNKSHNHTDGLVMAIEIKMIVNDDGIPILWTIESKKIRSDGKNSTGAKGVLQSLDIL